ncbi:adenosine deaminase [Acetobacter fallax]|uniref:Adenine deaminase n=1 Tax=Acetobacter fallax TaxID=1737473 RepID=A0ABX0K606_9PROT|nr:adenosine deaminase [Acetobacter fallax]NHO31744.1 adenosine deaminase [Acetobacter fallax]NHO35303.1 adenosine deaminase [Acetobacter fallax]
MASGRRIFLANTMLLSAAMVVGRGAGAAPARGKTDEDLTAFIQAMPKTELHVHIEGTLEPEMKFQLAKRNGVALPYNTVADMRASYNFHDLQSFLKIFYEGKSVLLKEQDFYDLTYAYLTKAAYQNVLYSEIFFDPQMHTDRGIPFETVIMGLTRAQADARRQLHIDSQLVMCFERELSADSAMRTLEMALPYRQHIVGVGLDSDEKNNPPDKFRTVFARARQAGFHLTMHCDLDQLETHEHIRQALEDLHTDRIDHGGNILERADLVAVARRRGVAFTVCPVACGWLRQNGENINIVRGMLDQGLKVTVSSDDPAYMKGNYVGQSLIVAQGDAALSRQDLLTITRNGIDAAWISAAQRKDYLSRLEEFRRQWT